VTVILAEVDLSPARAADLAAVLAANIHEAIEKTALISVQWDLLPMRSGLAL
jgi:hypothetical protein